jgi:hypothetical protein
MKINTILLTGIIILTFAVSAMATKPLYDYSFIRGVCYPGGWRNDSKTIERDLGYAKRLMLNSTRVWLSSGSYQQNPEGFINQIRNYVRIANSLGISTMPILFNGNSLNPQTLPPETWAGQEAYVKAVVDALKNEPGLIMWDIMNEPSWNDYHNQATEEEKPKRIAEISAFLTHFTKYVKSLDPVNAITIGHTFAKDMEWCTDVDVFSFHDYLATRAKIEESYVLAESISKKYNKPVLNSEMACICRSNPYDVALEICERHKMGWYLFELMVQGGWSEVHGLVYPDGTVRDPSIIAAIYGWHRNRDMNTMIKENPNREGHVQKAIAQLQAALDTGSRGVRGTRGTRGMRGAGSSVSTLDTNAVLEAAEYCANLLEASQMVPMHEPPTAKIQFWRSQPPEQRDQEAIRKFALELGQTLKQCCGLL